MADDQGPLAAPVAATGDAPGSASRADPSNPDDRVELAPATREDATRTDMGAVGSEPTAASSSGQPVDPGKSIIDDIASLKAQQKRLREEKKALSRNLRNAERRRSRLKKRAKALSDNDLLAVISLRNHEKALGSAAMPAEESGSDTDAGDDPEEVSASTISSPARRRQR